MSNIEIQRQLHLEAIAQKDTTYQIWKQCYDAYSAQFEEFANAQQEMIRNILWGYAEAGRLMYQRMVNLACCHMVFADELTGSDMNST